jgi:hypothetical protein
VLASLRTASMRSGRISHKRRTLHEPTHVLPPDQRNVFAKLLPVTIRSIFCDATILLRACLRTSPPMPDNPTAALGKIGIHALVFFFQSNCQRQYFALVSS